MKPVLVSGIQPTGKLHIGNYLGALKNFVALQNSGKYGCYFIVVDLHSLTADFNPKEKRTQILELTADFLAAGLDPKKSHIFLQSLVPAHTELGWIFETITPLGELRRMTQFKGKAFLQLKGSNMVLSLQDGLHMKGKRINAMDEAYDVVANAGLLTYPALMAADILLYDAKFVPVGDDQDQHLELTRTLARKFNARFGKTFIEPQALHTSAPRVMSLGDPHKKMSKSQPETCLFIDDSPAEIEAKVKRAVTDSGSEIKFDKIHKPAISNLLTIYSSLTGEAIPRIERRFAGKNYSAFKAELAAVIADHFADFRKKKKALLAKPAPLASVLRHGSKQAAKVANAKMAEVKKKVGVAL